MRLRAGERTGPPLLATGDRPTACLVGASSAGWHARTRSGCSRWTVEGRELVASPWTPPPWTADPAGGVLPEFVWAVLEFPTYFAAHITGELTLSVLAALCPDRGSCGRGRGHVVIGWPMETDGRKRYAGAAVMSAEGKTLAIARALLIEPRAG